MRALIIAAALVASTAHGAELQQAEGIRCEGLAGIAGGIVRMRDGGAPEGTVAEGARMAIEQIAAEEGASAVEAERMRWMVERLTVYAYAEPTLEINDARDVMYQACAQQLGPQLAYRF